MRSLHFVLPLALASALACTKQSSNPPRTTDGAVPDGPLPGPDTKPDLGSAVPDRPLPGFDAQPNLDSGSTAIWPDDQIRALIAQMTIAEKAAQLGNTAPAIPRLGIPAYEYWSECLHGVLTGGATSFPQAIALASTWNPALVEEVASAISDEARAIHVKTGKGLTYWAPVINMLRDPRWGRYEESYSEDPWLMARTAVAFVHGLQGRDPKFLKVVATPKHYAGNNSEYNRHNGSSDIDEQILHEYYLPAFEAAVREGGAFSVMAAYNRVNGVPASANPMLLKDVLRGAWGFRGYVVSDCDAVWDIANSHHWVSTLTQAAGAALVAGTDLNCGSTYPSELQNAVEQGFVAQADIDTALFRVLRARFLLGEFSPAKEVPFSSIDASVIESKANADLALEAARAAIVLLKNTDALLPLEAKSLHSIALIGPHANDVTLGGYSGNPSHTVTALAAIKARFASTNVAVNYQAGTTVTGAADASAIAAAADAARSSDVAVVLVGTSQDVLREEMDRPNWLLPGAQGDLIQAVFAANPKTIVVLVTAGPVAVDWAQANVPAILTAFYDGQEQGTAIADALFGDVTPGGKLTTTWYTGSATLPPIGDYDLRKGRTYLYYKDQPLYPFGFGLSYTTFAYANLKVSPDTISAGSATVSVDVTNSGSRAGDEVVQLYVHDVAASVPRPIQELRGFERITLAPGEKRTVSFPLATRNLAFWSADAHDWKVEDGKFDILVGSSSADIRVRGTLTVAATSGASDGAVDQ